MKRKIFLATIVVSLVVIIGGIILYSCQKENKISSSNPEKDEFSINSASISDLIAQTGIDIYKLSNDPIIQKVAAATNKQVAIASLNAQLLKQTALTPQIAAEIHSLKNAIEAANANGDYDTFFTLYEQLYSIASSISEISIHTDGNGLQIIEFNDKNYNFPSEQLAADRMVSESLLSSITEQFPQYPTLPYETRKQVIASAIYLNVEQNGTKNVSSDCRTAAQAELAIRLTLYTAAYTLTAASCAGTTVFIFICEGVAFATYIDSCTGAINSYKRTIANC